MAADRRLLQSEPAQVARSARASGGTDGLAARLDSNQGEHASSENESILSTSEGDTVSVGVGVSALFYLRQPDRLRTYACPRYVYSHGESTTTSTLPNPIFDDNESTFSSNAHSLFGAFGAQYSVHERFSIFGEVGVGFSHQRSSSDVGGTSSSSNRFATRTGAGVILYF